MSYNIQLMNRSNYKKENNIKGIISNYYNIESLGNSGDEVAISIKLDIEEALFKNKAGLTEYERDVIIAVLIEGELQVDVAIGYGNTHQAISQAVERGIEKIVRVLNNGKLFGGEENE